jgi:hypothetical protein
MLKWICALALAAGAAGPALAQKPGDKPAKIITKFDEEPIKEGMRTTGQSGECTATFVIGKNGKAKNITADCPTAEFVPYVVRSVQGAAWEPEVFDGEVFDSRPQRQRFVFGTVTVQAVDPRGEKGPVMIRTVQEPDLKRVIDRLKESDRCELKFTVGADGIPKDIQPNCTVEAANLPLIEAVKKMKFTPAQKDGQPTDWPGMVMPVGIIPKDAPKDPPASPPTP